MIEKEARLAITFCISITAEDLGLDNNCTEEELEAAAKEWGDNFSVNAQEALDWSPNDIEIELEGF